MPVGSRHRNWNGRGQRVMFFPSVFGAIFSGLAPGDIDFFFFDGTVRCRQMARRRIYDHGYDPFGPGEIHDRFIGQGRTHKPGPDGGTDRSAGKTFSSGPGLVITDPNAGYHLGRITDKPGIPVIIGGACFPGSRIFLAEVMKGFGCAVNQHILKHLGGDEGDGREKRRV